MTQRNRRYGATSMLVMALVLAASTLVATPSGAVTPGNAHVGLVSNNPADRTPHVLDGKVDAVVDLGSRVLVGGTFTKVKKFSNSTVHNRVGLFAYDKATGDIDPTFVPVLNGQVRTMVASPDGSGVIIGGTFSTLNGVARLYLAKVDVTTGADLPAFKTTVNGWVNTLAVSGNRLFLGGLFTKVRQSPRLRLAAVDALTGLVDPTFDVPVEVPTRGTPLVWRLKVTPDGGRLVVIGSFQKVGGQARTQVATIDIAAAPAQVTGWQTNWFRYGSPTDYVCSTSYDYYVKDVDIDPTGRYFVVVTTGASGINTSGTCDTASRWELGTESAGLNPTWREYTGADSLSAVAITGPTVYVAGHQKWSNHAVPPWDVKGPGAQDRPGIAALDPASGVTLSWTVQRDRGVTVGTLTATPEGLYIGSDSGTLGNEWHPRFGFLPLSGGTSPVVAVQPQLPGALVADLITGERSARSFDGATVGGSTVLPDDGTGWQRVRGIVHASDRTFRFLADGTIEVSLDGAAWAPSPSWTDSSRTFANVSGVAYLDGKLYYTITGNPTLYARGFTPDGPLVGTLRYSMGSMTGLNRTTGLAAAGGRLYQADATGTLNRVELSPSVGGPIPVATATTLAVTGLTTVGGPAVDGVDWSSITGLFAA